MDLDTIWKAALAVITAAGGYGAFALLVIKFSSGFIADKLQKKYELKLNKELEEYKTTLDEKLEKYKSSLENKTYISKTRFDAEFNIYKELSKSFFTMDACIYTLIPVGLTYESADEEIRKANDKERFKNATNAIVDAQNCLYQNTPFIPEVFVTKYQELLVLANKQTSAFMQRWVKTNLNSNKDVLEMDVYERSAEIHNKLMELNTDIRNYLSTLDVLD